MLSIPPPAAETATINGEKALKVKPLCAGAAEPLAVRLSDGANFYNATGGSGGGLTNAELRAVPVAVADGGGSLTVDGTVAVSGSVAVTGTFFQATQPVSLASAPTTPVTGTFWQATQPVSLAALPALADKSTASNSTIGSISLGNTQGKTNVLKTGNLVTTAATADQVILTYTVTAGKTFYLQGFDARARLTTFAATATLFGACSLESPAGTKLYTMDMAGSGVADVIGHDFAEPIAITAGTVIRLVCTPAAATSFTWKGNLLGFER